ncbi:hypothetical protein [Stieleria varia]|uniref:Uncharacterized protein n=1 Tax=Stieleria varia TaxID=2528005 RepID=A0A5C5ZMH0_9BACT|nr:hypothetical protein [Stieleria varia]TWT88061.1 hypothetical protein Pla52n_69120 [Stieleria varia]
MNHTLADQVASGAIEPRPVAGDAPMGCYPPEINGRMVGSIDGGFDGDSSRGSDLDDRLQAIEGIATDINGFFRGFLGRFRQVVIRASQLAEQEEMLKQTLAAVDSQQAEWTLRTEARERDVQEQASLLADAWLTVESERRSKLAHGKAVVPTNPTPTHAQTFTPPGNISLAPAAREHCAPSPIRSQISFAAKDISGRDASKTSPIESDIASDATSEPGNTPSCSTESNEFTADAGPTHSHCSAPDGAQAPIRDASNPGQIVPTSNPDVDCRPPAIKPVAGTVVPPAINPTNPWQQQASSAEAQSDAVKQFQRLRREIRSKQNHQ